MLNLTEDGKSKKKEMFNQRLSLDLKDTKCLLQHSVQSVMMPSTHFEEKALIGGNSFPLISTHSSYFHFLDLHRII